MSWVRPQEIPTHDPSPGPWRSSSQGWVAFCSSKKCNIHYEEKLLVTANCVEVCLLEVMCRGLHCLFTFVTEKIARRVQVKSVDLASLQGNSPCVWGTRCCPKISGLLCQLHHCRLSACCNTRTQLCGFRGWQFFAHAELNSDFQGSTQGLCQPGPHSFPLGQGKVQD